MLHQMRQQIQQQPKPKSVSKCHKVAGVKSAAGSKRIENLIAAPGNIQIADKDSREFLVEKPESNDDKDAINVVLNE